MSKIMTETQPMSETVTLLLGAQRSKDTQRTYKTSLRHFFGGGLEPRTVDPFLRSGTANIHQRLIAYKGQMIREGLASNTVNGRLAAIRSLLTTAKALRICETDGSGVVDNEPVKAYRDTRGFEDDVLQRLIALCDTSVMGLRDRAMMCTLYEIALRRKEVCALTVGDFDEQRSSLWVLGKGRGTQEEAVQLSEDCVSAIKVYLAASGHGGIRRNFLFQNLHHANKDISAGLTPDGLYYILCEYGREIGVRITPHMFRHTSISKVAAESNGNVPLILAHSRHRDPKTAMAYIDNLGLKQKSALTMVTGLFTSMPLPQLPTPPPLPEAFSWDALEEPVRELVGV